MSLVLGLGSNLGNRENNIVKALTYLEEEVFNTTLISSSVYETQALLLPNSPKAWDKKFLNLVVKGETTLEPFTLLTKIKEIETRMGRTMHEKWSPREIDIDILAYDSLVIVEKNLIIPHIELLNRKWVVIPFAEIHPNWKYPVKSENYQKSIKELSETIDFTDEYFYKTEYEVEKLYA